MKTDTEKTIYYPYYRVSTKHQGKSGLSLEHQRDTCLQFIHNNNGIVGEEFQEVETATGRKRRPVLTDAVKIVKQQNGVLLVASLDRLTRDPIFFFTLQKEGIKFKTVDNPNADETILGIMAVLASGEAQKIKARCIKAVETRRKRGLVMGNEKITEYQKSAIVKAAISNKELAYEANKEVSDIICNLKSDFIRDEKGKFKNRTYLQVAQRLNEIGKRKQNGSLWDAKSVEVLYKRYCK